IRVPLVVAGPGIPAARRGGLVQGIDLAPTLARMVGTGFPGELPGRDLFGDHEPERPAFLETKRGRAHDGTRAELVAVRTARPHRALEAAPAARPPPGGALRPGPRPAGDDGPEHGRRRRDRDGAPGGPRPLARDAGVGGVRWPGGSCVRGEAPRARIRAVTP